ncbi:LysR family transcriptional regulator [Aliiroseovarius sp. M344]|uniref:LysR family transcriptional regulator n=1 Tax=Aliiroseovarius sp. M344 TaxID=2867010 RepID=UPI0021ADAA0E|nr:LysR family transcriptional regulator [Aliiroseovarius sp. M344]UWQ12932.1 LysR family transcriptional regulator [Aliiroseovarius sp. M344]
MRVFLAVMREGSTLAASRNLGVNQTTVARRIDVLEHDLDVTLFVRTTRGAEPTDIATTLLPYAEALEQAAHTLEAEAEAEKGRASAPIRITAFEDEMFGNIGAVVSEFVENNPGVSFEFVFSERNLDLMKGEADVALRMTPAISDDRLIARKVGQTQWTYYASHAYAASHTLPAQFSDDMEDHRVHLLNHFQSKRRNLVRCTTSNDMMMAIQTGQGNGPFPVTVGDANANLVRCFDPPPGSDLPVWLIVSPSAYQRPEIRRFTAFAAPRIARNLKNPS